MSLIVTAYTQEGIVIGADSCITTNFTQEGKELYKHSHCGNKLFLLNNVSSTKYKCLKIW